MKICPKCTKEYNDETNICLNYNEKLIESDSNNTILIEDSKINEKLNKKNNYKKVPIYYYFGIILIVLLAYISYQLDFFFWILFFPTLGAILYSKINKDEAMKVKPIEVVKTMPVVFIVMIIIGGIIFLINFPFLFR